MKNTKVHPQLSEKINTTKIKTKFKKTAKSTTYSGGWHSLSAVVCVSCIVLEYISLITRTLNHSIRISKMKKFLGIKEKRKLVLIEG